MNKTALGLTGGILLLIISWFVGYNLAKGDGTQPASPRIDNVDLTENQSADDSGNIDVVSRAEDAADPEELSDEPPAPLQITGFTDDQSGETAQICIRFSQNLAASRASEYRDYVEFDPSVASTPSISGRNMCFSGLDYASDYTVTVRSGLTAESGAVLEAASDLDISFGDKPPFVAFEGQGIILPRKGAQGLGINSLNVERLKVEIFEVNDRIIARRNPQRGETTASGDYGYEWENAATQVRNRIYTGELDVDMARNQSVTTVLDLAPIIPDDVSGAYIVRVENISDNADENRPAQAWRWIVNTDIALTSYESGAGYVVTARSIQTAKPLSGIKVDLVARNNDLLASETTSANGRVTFPAEVTKGSGVQSPVMIMAFAESSDFALLDLRRPALDLSDRPVGGRQPAGLVDVYAFTDRGVYRPGETVNFTAMMRDNGGNAIADRPGHYVLYKPNGAEFLKTRFEDLRSGALVADMRIPTSAPRGSWSIGVELDGLGEVKRTSFAVEDFVPQTLGVTLSADTAPLRARATRAMTTTARFFYGANGSGLQTTGESRLRVDPSPFDGFEDVQFGRVDDVFYQRLVSLGRAVTDGDGVATLRLDLRDVSLDTSHPLRADTVVSVSEPGGRVVTDSQTLPVRTQDSYLGVKPSFDYDRAPRGKPAAIELVGVSWEGTPLDGQTVNWTLVEEDYDYVWFRRNERWSWRRDVRDIPLKSGEVTLQDGRANWSERLGWGDYRLILTSADDAAEASYRFSVGWSSRESEVPSPDMIRVAGPEGPVRAGDEIEITIDPPYAGYGDVAIAGTKIHDIKSVAFGSGPTTIKMTAKEEWGAGVYVLVSAYTPRDASSRPVPRRAVGLSYVEMDNSDQILELGLQVPEKVRPRQSVTIPILITGDVDRRKETWVTLAAVDEGILRLTKYQTPQPADWFFGKQALGVDLRDDYARILNPNLGDASNPRSGGDQIGGEGLSAVPIKVISLYNGPVELSGNTAELKIDIPDFNGELRLMAVAWNETATGSASQALTVRDAVPALVSFPRFLAPGDTASATVSINNVEGENGTYDLAMSAAGPLTFAQTQQSLALSQGEREDTEFTLTANGSGISQIDLGISGPEDYAVASDYALQVRSPFMPVTRTIGGYIAPGETFTLSPEAWRDLEADNTDIMVSLALSPVQDASAYAASLYRYPYGCTEQTVSRALPLLYAEDLGGIGGVDAANVSIALQDSVDRLINRQGYDGAFGLWRENDGYASPWLGVYTVDFLQRAKSEGLRVPQNVLDRAYRGLVKLARMDRYPGLNYNMNYANWRGSNSQIREEAAAYAFYVLARADKASLGDMRYFHDNTARSVKSPLAHAHLGAALKVMGDNRRAREAFGRAMEALGHEDNNDYYQSPLRDLAGVVALANEAEMGEMADRLTVQFQSGLLPPERLHTQEKAQVILAIKALQSGAGDLDVRAEGIELTEEGPIARAALRGRADGPMPTFTNRGDEPVWRSVTVTGHPVEAPPASAEGYQVTKTVYRPDGREADLSSVVQGDKLIVAITVRPSLSRERSTVIADLLPAGWEIETILRPLDGRRDRKRESGPYAWLGEIDSMQVAEARDDRFVAAADMSNQTYRVAYMVRAVTEGDYVLPGVFVEDMYRPGVEARTETRRTQVEADPEG